MWFREDNCTIESDSHQPSKAGRVMVLTLHLSFTDAFLFCGTAGPTWFYIVINDMEEGIEGMRIQFVGKATLEANTRK